MALLIKNQILKHLSKFTKNLSPDKIKVSTLKGEGDLHNLELDEVVLMDILDLPTWLKLTKATVNKLSIKIQWTKLKAQPIWLVLDEVIVEMEACQEPRKPVSQSDLAAFGGGKYGFAERIIDGMSVSINSVSVNFTAPMFHATIQMSRIVIQSKTPLWQLAELSMTRVKDELRGEVLIFKEAEWQTMRVEANAMEGLGALATTPLRLICQQGKSRVVIKKSLLDSSIIASRLVLNLDDLLWVLTDTQMKAAVLFANSLKEIIKKSSEQSKLRAGEKIEKQNATPLPPSAQQKQQSQRPGSRSQQALAKLFDKYNVIETSYHLYTGRIDLHLCDDTAPAEDGYRRKVEGGAMQVTLHKFCFDFYPYHPAGTDKTHWLRYDENMTARNAWADELYTKFKQDIRCVRQAHTTPAQTPTSGITQTLGGTNQKSPSTTITNQKPATKNASTPTKPTSAPRTMRLLESCYVLRLEDYSLYRVSTANDSKRSMPKKFLSSDKKQLLLPSDMSSLHFEYTEYYFPEGYNFPVPHTNLFVMLNPLRFTVDYLTILWLNAFSLNILKAVDLPPPDDSLKYHMDVKLCALMPRVIFPTEHEILGQSLRPEGLQIQLSHLTITNTHLPDSVSSLEHLQNALKTFQPSAKAGEDSGGGETEDSRVSGGLFQRNHGYPCKSQDLQPINPVLKSHANHTINPYYDKNVGKILSASGHLVSSDSVSVGGPDCYYNMTTDSLKRAQEYDLWCVVIEQFWMEFIGVSSSRNRPLPFVESFPMTLWLTLPNPQPTLTNQSTPKHTMHDTHTPTHDTHTPTHAPLTRATHKDTHNKGRLMDLLTESAPDSCDSLEAFSDPDCADMYVLLNLTHTVTAELNHYQYLFLMRLIETITNKKLEMTQDTEFIMGPAKPSATPVPTICVAVCLKEVEFSIIAPPIPEILTTEVTPSSTESMDINAMADQERDESGLQQDQDVGVASEWSGIDSALGGSVQSDQTVLVHDDQLHTPREVALDPAQLMNGADDLFGRSASPNITITDSGVVSMSNLSGASAEQDNRHEPLKRLEFTGNQHDPLKRLDYNASETASIASSTHSQQSNTNSTGSLNTTSADVRKSFKSAFSSLSSKVKNNAVTRSLLDVSEDGLTDDWETISNLSGASEDGEFEFLNKLQSGSEMPAFDHGHSMSDTTSVTDDSDMRDLDSTSIHTTSTTADKATGMVSVVTFKLTNTSAVVQLIDEDVSVCAEVYGIEPKEYGNIQLDTYRSKYTTVLPHFPLPVRPVTIISALRQALPPRGSDKTSTNLPVPTSTCAPIKMRFDVGPAAEVLASTASERGHLGLRACGLNLELSMSSLTSLTDLIEDELIPLAMPLTIHVHHCDITLKNDQPPTYPTSPGAIPMDLHISSTGITRGEDGVFRINTETSQDSNSHIAALQDSAHQRITLLETDKKDLTHQLSELAEKLEKTQLDNSTAPDNLAVDNNKLEALTQENSCFLSEILKLQDDVVNLKQERESLLATITFMQEELSRSSLQKS